MPKFKLVFQEERSRVRAIEVEAEGETHEDAAQTTLKAYQDSKYDDALEAVDEETEDTRNEVAYYNDKGEYVVLIPWGP